ncbi:hypothetical protein CBS147330_9347 [Penicillium roqueforti]|nr:hypothetical protein CBS147330_9347 [Penicillium roqueforti]
MTFISKAQEARSRILVEREIYFPCERTMDHHHPPTQVSDQVAAPSFLSGETDSMLSSYVALQSDLDEAYRKYLGYADIIGRGDLMAPLLGDSIFYPEVERTAARIFGEPRPRLVQGNVQAPIEWTDVLRESLTPGDFQRQENGMFLCRVRGSLIEVSEASYLEILTGVTERLLQPLQNLSDEQKETRARLKLGAYLHQTHESLVQFASAVRESIIALGVNPAIHDMQLSSIGFARARLPTPMSAPPVTPTQWVPYMSMSHTEGDIHESTIKEEETEFVRFETPGILGSYLAESRHPDSRGRVQSARSDVFRGNFIDSMSERNGYTPSSVDDLSSIDPASSSDYYASSIGITRSNSTDSASHRIAMDAYHSMVAASAYLNHNNYFNPELIDSNVLSVNNHAVENTDANVNSDVNARTEPSKLTSEMNVNSITPWLRDIDTSSDVGGDAESFGSNIPWLAQSEDASRPADTAAEQYGTRYRGVKRLRTECSSSESESKPGAGTRYSPREEADGPAFVKCLVDKGSTSDEIEEQYFKIFGVSRSAKCLCKKFEMRGTWGLLKSHREAKMQRTMSS